MSSASGATRDERRAGKRLEAVEHGVDRDSAFVQREDHGRGGVGVLKVAFAESHIVHRYLNLGLAVRKGLERAKLDLGR